MAVWSEAAGICGSRRRRRGAQRGDLPPLPVQPGTPAELSLETLRRLTHLQVADLPAGEGQHVDDGAAPHVDGVAALLVEHADVVLRLVEVEPGRLWGRQGGGQGDQPARRCPWACPRCLWACPGCLWVCLRYLWACLSCLWVCLSRLWACPHGLWAWLTQAEQEPG